MMKGMKKMISRITPALALLVATVATTTLHADTLDRVVPRVVASGAEAGPTIHVVNNHSRPVSVYVVDSHNRLRLVGRVGSWTVKNLPIRAGLARGNGTVQLKIYPVLPVFGLGMSVFEPAGIETRVLSVQSDQVIELLLEPDLKRSRVGIVSS